MTHLRAMWVQDELKAQGVRSFIARQKSGKRWVYVVCVCHASSTEWIETLVQWKQRKVVQA